MKICHIVHGLPESAGTTAYVLGIAKVQIALGHDVTIATFNDAVGIKNEGFVLICAKKYEDIEDCWDVVHIHALWSICQIKSMLWCQKRAYRYVISVHGSLMPRVFAKSPLKKWVFYWLFLKGNIKKACAIHCTSEYERQVCEKLGFEGPFIVAPLGIDMPKVIDRKSGKPCRTVLFVGRLGEEKGLVNLLDVWKVLPRDGWRLVLAGPDWLGYKKVLDDKMLNESIDGVEFTGAVYGDKKDALYRSADIFVLPSPMENFSMVVLEALAYGVPAIATKGTPWGGLVEYRCGWWIDQGVDALKTALQSAMSIDDVARSEMGDRGRNLAKNKYSWASIAAEVLDGYRGVIEGCCRGGQPS